MTPADPAPGTLHRTHWMAPLFRIAAVVRSLWPLAAFLLIDAGTRDGFSLEPRPLYVWVGAGWLVLGSANALLAYAFHRYACTPEGLVWYTGVLSRQDRRIPAREIREISEQQSLLQRALGLATVRIHTAGSPNQAEVTLEHLSLQAVRELRAALSIAPVAAQPAVATSPADTDVLLRLGAGDLIRIGLIENRGFVVLFAAYALLPRMLDDWLEVRLGRALDGLVADFSGLLAGSPSWLARVLELALGAAVILILLRVLSISWNFYHRHGFTLRRAGSQLHIAQGLGVRRDDAIPADSIQLARIDASALHRLAGAVSVRVTTSGGLTARAEGERALAPVLRAAELDRFLTAAFAGLEPAAGAWRRLPERSRRRFAARFLLFTLLPLVAVLALSFPWSGFVGLLLTQLPFVGTLPTGSPAALAAGAVGWVVASLLCAQLYARAQQRFTAYRLGSETLQFRTGWLSRRTWIFPYASLHTVDLEETPFDRRHHMRSLSLAGAGGAKLAIPFLDVRTAVALYTRLVHEAQLRAPTLAPRARTEAA